MPAWLALLLLLLRLSAQQHLRCLPARLAHLQACLCLGRLVTYSVDVQVAYLVVRPRRASRVLRQSPLVPIGRCMVPLS